jgi:cellulose synthase/poly-beta-1,6-N-acetylglucosamine synthase-like glycosyltransferase
MSFAFIWPFLFWLYVAATLFQMAVILGVFSKIRNPQSAIPNPQSPIPVSVSVSILLCARNEADNLRRHLPAILAQQYEGDWELMVVDDASDDESPALLREWQQAHPRLRVLRVPEKKQPVLAGPHGRCAGRKTRN